MWRIIMLILACLVQIAVIAGVAYLVVRLLRKKKTQTKFVGPATCCRRDPY